MPPRSPNSGSRDAGADRAVSNTARQDVARTWRVLRWRWEGRSGLGRSASMPFSVGGRTGRYRPKDAGSGALRLSGEFDSGPGELLGRGRECEVLERLLGEALTDGARVLVL